MNCISSSASFFSGRTRNQGPAKFSLSEEQGEGRKSNPRNSREVDERQSE